MVFFVHRDQKLGMDFQNKFLKWLRKNNYFNIKFNDEFFKYNDYDFIIRFESLKDDLIKLLNKYNIYDYTILNEILESSKGDDINHCRKGEKNFDYNTTISFKKDIPKYPIYFEEEDLNFISEYFKNNKYLKEYFI